MTRSETVRLVAEREITTRVRARSFRIGLLVAVLVVVGAIVLPRVIDGDDPPYEVRIVGELTEPEIEAIRFAGRAVGRDVVVEDSTREDADAAVAAGRADLVVVDRATLVVKRVPSAVDTGTFARFLTTARSSLRIYAGLYESGLDAATARSALTHPPPEVIGLLPPRDDRALQRALSTFGIVAIFVFVQQYGSWVLNGVVEEKSSRVIEVLLSVTRPSELLVGKTIGIGAVALLHGLVLVISAIAAAVATGSDLLDDGGLALLLSLFGWLLLAYALYSLLMAAAGSLVANAEDAQNVAFPVLAPFLAAYMVSMGTIWSDEVPAIVRVLSFVPFCSPVAMPVRLAVGSVPTSELVISLVLLVVAIVVAARVASLVYGRAVLHTSGRLRWRQVLRDDVAV